MYVNQSHTCTQIHRSNKAFFRCPRVAHLTLHPSQAVVQLRNTRKNNHQMFKFVLFTCKYGVSTKQQRHDHLWSANSVNRLQRSPSNHRRLKMMSDVVGKMQKYSALCPRAFHVCFKGHIQKEKPHPNRDRKAVVPP